MNIAFYNSRKGSKFPEYQEIANFLKEERELSEELNRKFIRIKKDGAMRKKLSDWTKKQLLNEPRENESGWRLYSLMDILWLEIVEIMRSIGYSVSWIKMVKAQMDTIESNEISEYPLLELAYYNVKIKMEPTFLVIMSGGMISLYSGEQLTTQLFQPFLHMIKSFLPISINGILGSLNFLEDRGIHINSPVTIPDDRTQLLDYLESEAFDEVKFNIKDGKIDLMEGSFVRTVNEGQIAQKEINELKRRYSNIKTEEAQYDFYTKKLKATIQKKVRD